MADPKKKTNPLLDPGQLLTGKDLGNAANQLTRIELRPGLKALARARGRYRRDQGRDLRGLANLSKRTDRQLKGLYQRGNQVMEQGVADSRANAAALSGAMANTASGTTQDQVALQSSILGNQINSLADQMIQPGYSASQNALANAAANQQQRRQDTEGAWANLASTVGSGNIQQSQNQQRSVAQRGIEDRSSSRYMLASRMADTRNAYGEAGREAAGKMADMKALWGPTRLKNLLDLRAGERSFGNERASIIASTNQANADRAFDYAKLNSEERQNAADNAADGGSGGSGGGDYSLWDQPGKLQKPEYRAAADAAKAYLKGRPVDDWQAVASEVAKTEGISWSPTERKQFIQKFAKRYKPRQ
jgi:hypothetical protein